MPKRIREKASPKGRRRPEEERAQGTTGRTEEETKTKSKRKTGEEEAEVQERER